MFITTKRIIRTGFLNFMRNSFVSAASVLVISITLFVIGALIFFSAIMDASLAQLRDKVDINVYFVTEAHEGDILPLRDSLEKLPEVAQVVYTSREEALDQFKDRHADDFLTIQAIEELGDNPLGASLNIKAKETSQYESIARFLEDQDALAAGVGQVIDKINYYQNKDSIDKLTKIIDSGERLGFAIVLVLVALSTVITFNTIRLAIYSSREEIAVMRLVGADNTYVRGPFIVEGMIYGLVAALVVIVLFYPLTAWVGDATERFFGGVNIYAYYLANFWQIAGILLISGTGLGIASSFMAVRRYLAKKYLRV